MSRLLDLYPGSWRERYEDEFLALIAERPPSLADRLDIVRGALDARLHPQVGGPQRVPDRAAGFVALAGFALLILSAALAATGPVQFDEYGIYREGTAAIPFFVAAFGLLAYGIYRLIDRFPTAARAPRVAGWIAIVAGCLWSVMPWVTPVGLTFLVAFLGFAVGGRRAGVVPAWTAVSAVVLLVGPAGLFGAMLFLPWYAFRVSGLDFLHVLGPLSGLWLIVGGLLLRGLPQPGRPRSARG